MISSRRIEEKDRPAIGEALIRDKFHPTTKVDVFYEPGTVANIYESDGKPVFVLRASRSLHIDVMFLDNHDSERNKDAMCAAWYKLVEGARAGGFKEITTSSNSSSLAAFVEKVFGFDRVQTEENHEIALRKVL